ncbi:DUF1800 domain-containing protein [Tahibacter soli]|uniref:DUF1800 domain-containing protein n=1 Tax=Tahibacter soli TaxID=2983605 RepID=A0A9X3YRM0_9GAMM|nr:DUF1800 domain-containing protein [Tahibacter soli]MDC8015743.1 DUF1800 domain-containing protein [Tahibacter soli]
MQRSFFAGALARVACALGVCAAGAANAQLSHRPDAMLQHGFEAASAGPVGDAAAARFLAQATFGPTLADIAHLRAIGYQAWLDEQFAASTTTSEPYLDWVAGLPDEPDGNNYVTDDTRLESWAINVVGSPDPSRGNRVATDQLRQRVAFALSEIFVVSSENGTLAYSPWSLASYHDMLAANAFGNYRTLLEQVTRHPAMGIYLNSIQNQKADEAQNIHPDENYAREVLQLFSVGLVQLNPDGTVLLSDGQPVATYTQTTVRGFAAVFTGWNWSNVGCGENTYTCCDEETFHWCGPSNPDEAPWQRPMEPVDAYHDTTTDKQLLVYDNVVLPNGLLVHGGNAQVELGKALDNIAKHPNVGPFMARRLIQRLVTSNPTPAYVQRVAGAFDDNGQGVRGDLKAVIRAILLDPEARYGQWSRQDTFGKLREPLLKLTHLWRAMEGRSTGGRIGSLAPWPPIEDWYGQAPLRSPTVFNFFKPDFRYPGEVRTLGLVSPEFQILSDTMVVSTPNNLYYNVFCYYTGSDRCWDSEDADTIQMNLARDAPLAASNPAQLIEKYNVLFMSGQMSPFMRNVLATQLATITQSTHGSAYGRVRVQNALYLIVNSPEYSIQK